MAEETFVVFPQTYAYLDPYFTARYYAFYEPFQFGRPKIYGPYGPYTYGPY